MKKILNSLLVSLMLVGAPVSLSSCDSDDVKNIIDIVVQLISSPNELSGTAWLSPDRLHGIEFGANAQGVIADYNETTKNVDQSQFSFSIGEDGSSLIFKFQDGTQVTYTIVEYTANKSMTLLNKATGKQVAYVFATDEEASK